MIIIEKNVKKDFYSDIDIFNLQPLVIENKSGKLQSTQKQIFHDYLKKQKETLLSRVKGFDMRLNDIKDYIKDDFMNDNISVDLNKDLVNNENYDINALVKTEKNKNSEKVKMNDKSVSVDKNSKNRFSGSNKKELASKYLRTLYVEANLAVSLSNEIDKQLKC